MGAFDVSYAGAFVAGLLSFLSPCVLPLVPPYLCFLGGVTLDQMTAGETPDRAVMRKVFVTALVFVLGFSTVFIAFGATASAIGRLVGDYLELFSQLAGIIIIILGLHFIGLFRIGVLFREARFHVEKMPAGLIGAYVIGLAFAFGWTPCVGPVLAAILMVAGSETSITYGASLLAVYSVGIGIPFLIAAAAVRPFLTFMSRFRAHLKTVERVIGALLVGTGVLFLTGSMANVAFWILEVFPVLGRLG